MLVTRVIGDCPSCKAIKSYGNVFITGDRIIRGCMYCNYKEEIRLPAIKKKIIYLDQFVYSHAFLNNDQRIMRTIEHLKKLSSMQIVIIPYSSEHSKETYQWTGYDNRDNEALMEYIRKTSRGRKFLPSANIEEVQIVQAFNEFLIKSRETFKISERHVFPKNIHEWENYLYFNIGRYRGDIELIRKLKRASNEQFLDVIEIWQESKSNFEHDVKMELEDAYKGYMEAYHKYFKRIISNDNSAYLDSPTISQIVESMLYYLPEKMPYDEKIKTVIEYFKSRYFSEIPYHWISSRIYALMKKMANNGAYSNRDKARMKLKGVHNDIRRIALYAPYCNAIVIDRAMAHLVRDPKIDIEKRYGVQVFSLTNWADFNNWLKELENNISEEHKTALRLAYPEQIG